MVFMNLTLIPLIDDMEQSLRLFWEIVPKVSLRFSMNPRTIVGQFYQVEGLPAPSIIPTPFPAGTSLLLPVDGGTIRVARSKYFQEPISFVCASQLRHFFTDGSPDGAHMSIRHKAIKAFLDTLPDDTRIVLWWD